MQCLSKCHRSERFFSFWLDCLTDIENSADCHVALRRHEDFEPEGYFVIKTVVTSLIDLNQSNQSLLAIDFPSSTEILFVVHRTVITRTAGVHAEQSDSLRLTLIDKILIIILIGMSNYITTLDMDYIAS